MNLTIAFEFEDYLLKMGKATITKNGRKYVMYEFYHMGKLIFSGNDFSPSPMDKDHFSIGSVSCLLGYFASQVGDTGDEYFENYTADQLEFSNSHGEDLSSIANDMEECQNWQDWQKFVDYAYR